MSEKTIGFIKQNNNFARASHFFYTFLSRFCIFFHVLVGQMPFLVLWGT